MEDNKFLCDSCIKITKCKILKWQLILNNKIPSQARVIVECKHYQE